MGFRIEKGKSQFILEDTGKFTVAPAALACPRPTHVFHNPLGRPVRLTGWPDSGGHPTGCRGDSATLRSPGNAPLAWTDGLVARTRWGTPPGHVPGVRFATREPAADACTFYGSDG